MRQKDYIVLTGVRTDKDKHTLGDGRSKQKRERWIDEKNWHGVTEHLIGEFWVILLIMEPPFQTETLVPIESKSAHKASDESAFNAVLEPSGGRVVFICMACVRDEAW